MKIFLAAILVVAGAAMATGNRHSSMTNGSSSARGEAGTGPGEIQAEEDTSTWRSRESDGMGARSDRRDRPRSSRMGASKASESSRDNDVNRRGSSGTGRGNNYNSGPGTSNMSP